MPETQSSITARHRERAKEVADAQAIWEVAKEDGGRDLTPEEQQRFDAHMASARRIREQIDREEQLAAEAAHIAELEQGNRVTEAAAILQPGSETGARDSDPLSVAGREFLDQHLSQVLNITPTWAEGLGFEFETPLAQDWSEAECERASSDYRRAFWTALMNEPGLSPSDRELVFRGSLRADDEPSGGFFTAGPQFAAGLLRALDQENSFRSWVTQFAIRGRDSLGIRKRTAKASTFKWGGEVSAPSPDTSLKFGKKVLTPNHWSARINLSRDLIRRGIMPVETMAIDEVKIDIAEGQEQSFFTGDGSGQALGIFTASDDGISTSRDFVAGTTTDPTFAKLLEAKYKIVRYLRDPSVRWVFHPDGIVKIANITDGQDNFQWRVSERAGEPDILLGLPVAYHEQTPNTFTTGQYIGMLAAWRYYYIADGLDQEVRRLSEIASRENEIEFHVRGTTDGMPVLEEAFARLKLA